MKLLVPVDGSKASDHAVASLIDFLPRLRERPQLHLLHVIGPIRPSATVHGIALEREAMQNYYDSEAQSGLSSAEAMLSKAGISFERRSEVGEAASTICNVAAADAFDMIWMGTRGMGGFANLLLGAVATKVLHATNIPIVMIPMHEATRYTAVEGRDFRT